MPTRCTGALVLYWSAVRDTFPEAWGKPPTESRLMHSAGIRAMGALMDQIMLRADSRPTPRPRSGLAGAARAALLLDGGTLGGARLALERGPSDAASTSPG